MNASSGEPKPEPNVRSTPEADKLLAPLLTVFGQIRRRLEFTATCQRCGQPFAYLVDSVLKGTRRICDRCFANRKWR